MGSEWLTSVDQTWCMNANDGEQRDCDSRDSRFEPGRTPHAAVAQWIERLTTNQEVGGSNPSCGTRLSEPLWRNGSATRS